MENKDTPGISNTTFTIKFDKNWISNKDILNTISFKDKVQKEQLTYNVLMYKIEQAILKSREQLINKTILPEEFTNYYIDEFGIYWNSYTEYLRYYKKEI